MNRFAAVASSLFVVAAGCGDDDPKYSFDAPSDDAPMADALPTGAVTVTTKVRCCTLTPGTPQAGVTVAVVQPNGTLGEVGVTDAAGQVAFANVQQGASITAIYPEDIDGDTDISTIVGVKPGDTLTFGESYYKPYNSVEPTGSVTVNFPDSHYYYQVWGPCSSDGGYTPRTSFTLQRGPGCDSATAPITLLAYNNSWERVATAYLPAADFSGTNPVTIDAWTPRRTDFAVSVSGLTAPMTAEFQTLAVYPDITLDYYTQGGELTNGSSSAVLDVYDTAPVTKTFVHLFRGDLEGQQSVYGGGDSPVALAAPGLPWLSEAIVNVKTGRAGWYQTNGTADGAVFRLEWQKYEESTESSHDYDWNIILPPGASEFELESPVPALAALVPGIADDVYQPWVSVVDLSSTADYDAFRQLPEWRMTDVDASVLAGDEASASESFSYDGGEGKGLRVIK